MPHATKQGRNDFQKAWRLKNPAKVREYQDKQNAMRKARRAAKRAEVK